MFYNTCFITRLTTCLIPSELDNQQHRYQKKMHALIQLQNSDQFTKKKQVDFN